MRHNHLRALLPVSAAGALLIGTLCAAAQGTPQQHPQGGAMERGAAQPEQNRGGSEPSQQPEQRGRPKGKAQTTGQAPRNGDQQQQRSQRDQDRTTGQGGRDEEQTQPRTRQGNQERPRGQGQRDQDRNQERTRQQGQRQQDRDHTRGQGDQRTTGQGARGGASITLTTEQRTHIRESVLRGGHAPRVTNVNFSIRVGTKVPRSIRVEKVPDVIVDIHPEWRGFLYFVNEDEVIIVDADSFEIVAVIDV